MDYNQHMETAMKAVEGGEGINEAAGGHAALLKDRVS